MGIYNSYIDLNRAYQEGVDFRRRFADRDGHITVLTPHGGGIEVGTSELTLAIAGEELPYYLFEGLRRGDNRMLHITSTRFDEPECLRLLENSRTALAIHGCAGKEAVAYVGGRDINLRDRILDSLRSSGFSAHIGRGHLAGKWQENICNRTSTGRGVQLEISTGLREGLFEQLGTRQGRQGKKDPFWGLVEAVREVIL